MPEMQSYMGVNEGNDGIIGKLLYYSTANILIPKDKFIELGNAFNLPKVKPARESAASAYRYATTALKDRIAEKDACGTHIYRSTCRTICLSGNADGTMIFIVRNNGIFYCLCRGGVFIKKDIFRLLYSSCGNVQPAKQERPA